jgi:CRISPR/Cas system CMR-associated protein Cmr5 small subunit
MNKSIENYIKTGMALLEAAEKKEGKLSKEYKGYLSSLGASIRMSGMVPALAFFSSKENSAKAERWKVINWIAGILKENHPVYRSIADGKALFTYARRSNLTNIEKSRLEKDILDTSVALKLCIRTFDLSE